MSALTHPRIDLRARWRPVALTSSDVLLITIALLVASVLRWYDYGTGSESDGVAPILRPAEAFMPMWAWSLCFGIGAATLGFGVWRRLHFFVWLGHSALVLPYSGLAVGILCGAALTTWGDGIRAAGALCVMAILHGLFSLRTGPRPLDPDRSQPVEVIAAGGDDG